MYCIFLHGGGELIKKLIERVKEYWVIFSANIYDGNHEAQNMRSIQSTLLLMNFFSFIMTVINLISRNYVMFAATSILCAIFLTTYLVGRKVGKRAAPLLICLIVVIVVFTYFIFDTGSEGFAVLWTLLVPVFLMTSLGVKAGACMGLYFQLVIIIFFWTPLRNIIAVDYTETFLMRFPLLYLCTLIISLVITLSNKKNQMEIDAHQEKLEKSVEEERSRVSLITFQTIATITRIVDAKDHYTDDHSTRVANYSALLARELGWEENDVTKLYNAALLHDIGKIGIQDSILKKIGRLEDSEYEIMKTHTSIGAEILSGLSFIDGAVEGALYHHEKYDGSGYPFGLRGETIPLFARIICIADAFDAMNSDRAYRKRCDEEYIISELKRCRGTHFDPTLVDAFFSCMEKNYISINGKQGTIL